MKIQSFFKVKTFLGEDILICIFSVVPNNSGAQKKLRFLFFLVENYVSLEIKPCGLGSRIQDVCSPKIYY